LEEREVVLEDEEFASDIVDFDVVVKVVSSEKKKNSLREGDEHGAAGPSIEGQGLVRGTGRTSHLQKRSVNRRSASSRHSHSSVDPAETPSRHAFASYSHPLAHTLPSYRQHRFLRSLPDYMVMAEDDSDEYLLALSSLYAYLRVLRNVLIVQIKVYICKCIRLLNRFVRIQL
jgi:hypothetical protein